MKTNEDVLNIIYKKNEDILFELDDKNIVTILNEQEHKIQKIFRKIGFKIPKYQKIEMDKISSYIFLLIDGKKTVKEIGRIADEHFGEKIYPLFERLLLFLNHIDVNCHYINRI